MSALGPQDHLDPHNPLYYAPRRLRERSERPSTSFAETSSELLRRPISTQPLDDALYEEAIPEALRHPLDPELIHEPPGFTLEQDRRKALFRVAGRFAAVIGVSASMALFFVITVPASQDHARQPDGVGSSMSGILDSVKAAFYPPHQRDYDEKSALSEFHTLLASSRTKQPVVTHEQSETLLQQFLQWQQKAP
jgi:hypothetical protein